jgi:cell division protein FtsB
MPDARSKSNEDLKKEVEVLEREIASLKTELKRQSARARRLTPSIKKPEPRPPS